MLLSLEGCGAQCALYCCRCSTHTSRMSQQRRATIEIVALHDGCWGTRTRTRKDRTRICSVANYTIPQSSWRNRDALSITGAKVGTFFGCSKPFCNFFRPRSKKIRLRMSGGQKAPKHLREPVRRTRRNRSHDSAEVFCRLRGGVRTAPRQRRAWSTAPCTAFFGQGYRKSHFPKTLVEIIAQMDAKSYFCRTIP